MNSRHSYTASPLTFKERSQRTVSNSAENNHLCHSFIRSALPWVVRESSFVLAACRKLFSVMSQMKVVIISRGYCDLCQTLVALC